MTILTGSATGNIFFNDGSGNDGVVQYVHSSSPNYMRIASSGHIRFDAARMSISDDNIAPTAGDMASGASFGIPRLHMRGDNAQSGAYELMARFQSGTDANDSGATIVLNHSNDRGLALQGGRGQSNRSFGAIKSVDNIGRLSNCIDFLGGNGAGVNYIALYTGESVTTTERFRIGSSGQFGIAGANYGTSGQVLTSQGSSSAPQWATPSGLTHAQQWYLTANGSTSSSNYDHVLPTDAGTWQKHSASSAGVSAGTLGSDMTYESNGIFRFPATGIWKIEFQGWWGIGASDSDHFLRSRIQTTINNSSYTTNQEQANSVKSDSTYTYQGFYVTTLFDVTDTSLCKCRFVLNPSGSNTYYKADGSPPKTGAQFMRLGDT